MGQSLPRGLAGDCLVLSEIPQRTQCLPVGNPGIHGDDRDFGSGGSPHRRFHDGGVGERDGDPRDLVGDRRAHEVGLSDRIRVV